MGMRMDMSHLDVFFLLHLDRHQMHITVPDTRLGNDPVRTEAHCIDSALQNDCFKAIVMVEVNVLGSDRHVMVVVLNLGQPIR